MHESTKKSFVQTLLDIDNRGCIQNGILCILRSIQQFIAACTTQYVNNKYFLYATQTGICVDQAGQSTLVENNRKRGILQFKLFKFKMTI